MAIEQEKTKKQRKRTQDFYGYIEQETYKYKKIGQRKVSPQVRYRVRLEYKQLDGTFKKISERFDKEYKAKDFLAKERKDYENSSKQAFENRDILLKDFAEIYKEKYLKQLASYKDEAPKIDHIIKFFGDIKLKDIRRIQLDNYKIHLIETTSPNSSRPNVKRSNRTVDGYLVRLISLLNYGIIAEVLTSVPSTKKLLLRKHNVRKETITLSEFFKLLNACDEKVNGQDRQNLKLLLIALHETAGRFSEVIRAKVEDIQLEKRIIKIWEAKREGDEPEEQRSAYISDLFYNAIVESGIMNKPKNALVFGEQESYKRSFATAKRIAGTDENRSTNFLIRDLRRTGITNMFKAGMRIEFIKKQVGHSANSRLTEEVYLALQDDFIVEDNQKYEIYMQKERAKLVVESESVN